MKNLGAHLIAYLFLQINSLAGHKVRYFLANNLMLECLLSALFGNIQFFRYFCYDIFSTGLVL
jgi:hypothetical protein